jgi:hypothetical protein
LKVVEKPPTEAVTVKEPAVVLAVIGIDATPTELVVADAVVKFPENTPPAPVDPAFTVYTTVAPASGLPDGVVVSSTVTDNALGNCVVTGVVCVDVPDTAVTDPTPTALNPGEGTG